MKTLSITDFNIASGETSSKGDVFIIILSEDDISLVQYLGFFVHSEE